MSRTTLSIIISAILLLAAASVALAHYPWILVLEEEPVLRFEIGWGHNFPRDGVMDPERIASLSLAGPDGSLREFPVSAEPSHNAGELELSGLYILAAQQVPSFYSRTAEGGQRGSRAEFPEVLRCSHSANSMKALVSRGKNGDPGRVLGHPLEIVPLADPAGLGAGETLPVKVLYQGRPFQGTVEATWDGQSDKEIPAVTTETDASGVARIPLAGSGTWLVAVNVQEPYPDPAVCDHNSYTATLTLTIP